MRWPLAWLTIALSCASLSAQTTRPVTFVWDVILGEPGVSAEIERNGAPASCPALGEPGPLERSCTLTVPVGPASFRARMANTDGEWGPWGDPVTLTIPAVTPGAPPGPFVIQFHRFSEAEAPRMATLVTADIATQVFGTTASCVLEGLAVGDVITVLLRERDGAVPSSVTSSLDGALTNRVNNDNAGDAFVRTYTLLVATAGDHTITVTFGGNSVFGFYADAWSGLASAVPSVSNTADNASGTSHSNGSVTTTGAGLILTMTGVLADASPYTAASGFTLSSSGYRSVRQYKLSGSAETTTGTLTSTGSVTSAGIALFFEDAAAGGAVAPIALHHYRTRRAQ